MSPAIGDIFYRAEGTCVNISLETFLQDGEYEVYYVKYRVTKLTPKGCWVTYAKNCSWNKPKFILTASRKKFAWPTKELAVISLIRRKQIQIDKLETTLELAKGYMKAALAEQKRFKGELL